VTTMLLVDAICNLAFDCIQFVTPQEFAIPACVLRCRHGHVYFS